MAFGFEYLLISLALNFLAFALMPKPQIKKPEAVTDIKIPSIEEGKEIPVVFGTMELAPFVAWYGDLTVEPIVERGPRKFGIVGPRQNITTGYRYLLGAHFLWCHDPVDGFDNIWIDDKLAFSGNFIREPSVFVIDQPELFGETEGGVQGNLNFEKGAPDQGPNDYLTSVIGGAAAVEAAGTFTTTVLGTSSLTYDPGITEWYVDNDQEGNFQSIQIKWNGTLVARLYSFNGVDGTTTSTIVDGITYTRGELKTPLDNDKAYEVSKTLVETTFTPADPTTYTAIVPAFRGLTGFVLRKMYLGNSPYLKKWTARFQRVFFRKLNGAVLPQWQQLTAGIGEESYSNASILITIDDSGSMAGTRAETARVAVNGFLENLRLAGSNGTSDIQIVFWSLAVTASITRRNFTASDIDALINTVNSGSLSSAGGTDYAVAVSTATDFFNNDGGKDKRVCIFITDGEGSNAELARDTLQAIEGLEVYTVGIETAGNLAIIDNTPDDGVPVVSESDPDALSRIFLFAFQSDYDMNPAHIIRECLTNDQWGLGYPEADIDDVSFTAAANALFGESLGISLAWSQQSTIEEFMQIVLNHADATLYVDRKTGLWTLKLIRKDYDVGTLEVITDADLVAMDDLVSSTAAELVNSVTIVYNDKKLRGSASLTVTNLAQVQQLGQVVSTTVNYPGIWRHNLAHRLAVRDLRSLSTPLVSGTIKVTRKAADFAPGSVFVLDLPRYGLNNLVCRVLEVDIGDGLNNQVTVKFVQDVFSSAQEPLITEAPDLEFVPVSSAPSPVVNSFIEEEPYYSFYNRQPSADADAIVSGDADVGFVQVGGQPPSNGAFSATVNVLNGASYESSIEAGLFAGGTTSATLKEFGSETSLVLSTSDDLTVFGLSDLIKVNNEYMRVDAYDNTTKTITVSRGMLDTVPQFHDVGSKVYQITAGAFVEPTQFTSGNTVNVKLLTNTLQGRLSLTAAPAITATLNSRIARPYPPGNLLVNGLTEVDGWTGNATVTWAHRDRVAQQSSSVLRRYLDGDIGPEAGVTYTVEVYSYDANGVKSASPAYTATGITTTSHVIDTTTVVPPAGSVAMGVYVKSVKGGYDSWQIPEVLCILEFNVENSSDFYFNINDASSLYTDALLLEPAQYDDEPIGSVLKQ